MRIYLSAPISHDPHGARQRFDELEAYARRQWPEAECFNPLSLGPMSWETAMVLDLVELKRCDVLLLHPTWRRSPGCRIEDAAAERWSIERWEMET